ncbi:hypothetical protein [Mycobacterium sp. 3519A]|uniref:hypothetical protein n=1 Tax=Mycobacterium sp. 3519A TaxID=2057184 RepID=UPI000C7D25A4|nr:hypothetical protein [Mycobacterium sp. 3519A]
MRGVPSCQACYLAEWYCDGLPVDGLDASFAMLSPGARLTSDDGETATAQRVRAGIPAERVTAATAIASA